MMFILISKNNLIVKSSVKNYRPLLSNIYWFCETGFVWKRPMTITNIAEQYTLKLNNLFLSHNWTNIHHCTYFKFYIHVYFLTFQIMDAKNNYYYFKYIIKFSISTAVIVQGKCYKYFLISGIGNPAYGCKIIYLH